jgi:hypothetical protein
LTAQEIRRLILDRQRRDRLSPPTKTGKADQPPEEEPDPPLQEGSDESSVPKSDPAASQDEPTAADPLSSRGFFDRQLQKGLEYLYEQVSAEAKPATQD